MFNGIWYHPIAGLLQRCLFPGGTFLEFNGYQARKKAGQGGWLQHQRVAPPESSTWSWPIDLSVSENRLYVADMRNNSVRIVGL